MEQDYFQNRNKFVAPTIALNAMFGAAFGNIPS
jgi:hypothetical protein